MQVGEKKTFGSTNTGWGRLVFLVLAWCLIISLARDVWQVRRGFQRITEAEERLNEAKEQNLKLKKQWELVVSDAYKEKMIRESLNMQKEGELVVVLPVSVTSEEEYRETVPKMDLKNWEKWWKLIWF